MEKEKCLNDLRAGLQYDINKFKKIQMRMLLFKAIGIAVTLLMPQYMALARPSTCWFQQTTGARRSPASYCDVKRVGQPGELVYRLITDGVTRMIYIEHGGYAEVLLGGKRYKPRWRYDNQGDIMLTFPDGSWFVFRVT